MRRLLCKLRGHVWIERVRIAGYHPFYGAYGHGRFHRCSRCGKVRS